MHKTLLASLIAGAFLLPAAASAQTAPVTAAAPAPAPNPFTGNVMLTSEYLYRGISQSNGKPAIQGGFWSLIPRLRFCQRGQTGGSDALAVIIASIIRG